MARTIKQDACDKVYGGQTVPAGEYIIVESDITVEPLKIRGQADSEFDSLNVRVAPIVNGAAGQTLETSIRLNGSWRDRVDKDGRIRKASGTFFDTIGAICTGKSFDFTRDHINSTHKGKKIVLKYDTYVSHNGQVGHIPTIDFMP